MSVFEKLIGLWACAVLTSTLCVVGWITYDKRNDPVLWFFFGLLVTGALLFAYSYVSGSRIK